MSGNRNVRQEVVSNQANSSKWHIQPLESQSDSASIFTVRLKDFLEFADELKHLKVADLEDLLNLDISFEKFDPASGNANSSKLFNTLGYKTVEHVLKAGDHLTVLGECSGVRQNENGTKVFDLSKPSTKGIFDLKVCGYFYKCT